MEVLQEASFSSLLATFSDDSHTKGKQFERLVKWWLTQDPIWSRKISNVWLWNEWPQYPGRDIGVDLVAEMIDGTLCAIQAKCFDENRDIPKSELDSFISAASHQTFQHRLLVATTDGLSANAKRMLAEQQVVRVMRSDLEASLDYWPSSIDELSTPPASKATPRPHQQSAIFDVTEGLKLHSRGQLIMACGTGKTLTALWIKEQLQSKTTLVLVPSLNLLAQTLSEWARNSSTNWRYLCVCSDDTVNKSDDQPISTVDELPFEVTTKDSDISHFLSLDGEKIIFSTYHSSLQVAQAQSQLNTTFDLVICDEAHRLTGKTEADYASVLDDSKIRAHKRLFMTATPRTYTTKAKAKAEDRGVEITSMDDEQIYGPVLHKLSFSDAIKQNLLSDYRVLIVGVTDPQVQELIDRRELVSINNSMTTDARTLAAHIGLAKATKDYNLKRTISFHSRIKTAEQFARDHQKILEWLPENFKPTGTTWTGTISGAMNTGERRKLLNQLRLEQQDRHAILTNARCLTEGVDVPTLDGVAFIDPRSSQVDIIQAVGRAIRKSDNKEIGTIVLPVLIPTDADVEHALDVSTFKPIWAILNALKSHDEELPIELDKLRMELGISGHVGSLPNRVIEHLPADINSLLPNFHEKFVLATVEHTTSPWEFWFGALQTYIAQNGNSFIPHDFRIGHHKLGQWVNTQRTKYKTGQLASDRVARLESLNHWTWSQLDTVWTSRFDLLKQFVEEFGHTMIPDDPDGYKDQKLFSWVQLQRSRYKRRVLEPDRVILLESLPTWTWMPKEDKWDHWFKLLQKFQELNGHVNVAQNLIFHDENLGRWINKQRARYRKGTLEQRRIQQLASIPGWTWDPEQARWDAYFSALQRFAEINGHAMPNKEDQVDALQLGNWVSHQRLAFKKGKLQQEKIRRLESLKNWSWDPLNDSWNSMFEALQHYAAEKGAANPPQNYMVSNLKLGSWTSAQKTRYNKGKLQTDRALKLMSLPGWTWNQEEDQWKQTFMALSDYVSEFGSASPPQSYVKNGIKLGAWAHSQRSLYRKGVLDSDKTLKLESLPGWTWYPLKDSKIQRTQRWDRMYSRLLEQSKNIDRTATTSAANSTGIERDLNDWAKRQRQSYHEQTLEEDKVRKLEAIPGWSWNPHSDQWEFFYSLLQEFVESKGHAPVSQARKETHSQDEHRLSVWASAQRVKFNKGALDQDKIRKLEQVPGWTWKPVVDSWEFYFQLLQQFSSEHGHARVPQGTAAQPYKGHNLSRWVNKQRSRYNSHKLENDRIRKLESVPGWTWNPFDDLWNATFELVKEFATTNGHVRIPRTTTDDRLRGLSTWLTAQRSKYRKGQLDSGKIALLDSLPDWK
jgi:superfamily II DNA or RNA helicase